MVKRKPFTWKQFGETWACSAQKWKGTVKSWLGAYVQCTACRGRKKTPWLSRSFTGKGMSVIVALGGTEGPYLHGHSEVKVRAFSSGGHSCTEVKISHTYFPFISPKEISKQHTSLHLLEVISFAAKEYHLLHGMFAANHRKVCFSLNLSATVILGSWSKSRKNGSVCTIWQGNLKPHQAPCMADIQHCSIQTEAIPSLLWDSDEVSSSLFASLLCRFVPPSPTML